MEGRRCFVLILLVVQVVFSGQWITTSAEENMSVGRKFQKNVPGNQKHLPTGNSQTKRRIPLPNIRELRKKPSGHLTALNADDMENDGVISVAVGPSPSRPKFNKTRKNQNKNNPSTKINSNNAVNIIKDVLSQLGNEFLSHQVNEDFVFGQFVGNSMKNLTREVKVKMQHEILDLIVKYQNLDKGDVTESELRHKEEHKLDYLSLKEVKMDKKATNVNNDTDEPWPDFTNLAKIVG